MNPEQAAANLPHPERQGSDCSKDKQVRGGQMNIGKKAGMAVSAILLAQAALFGQSVSKIDGVVFSDYY